MSLNPTNIEWTHCFGPGTGRTWNPVVGCAHGCPYCYARRQAKRQRQNCQLCYDFIPHLHIERLDEPLHRRKPTGIFLGSMCDLWDPHVPQEWRDRVWRTCWQSPQHQYFALTKQPQRITDAGDIPTNVMVGVSADNANDLCLRLDSLLPMDLSAPVRELRLVVSIEPLLESVTTGRRPRTEDCRRCSLLADGCNEAGGSHADGWCRIVPSPYLGLSERDWVIVGAETGPGAPPPREEWVDEVLRVARAERVPVFVKDNMRALYPGRDWPQEWPAGIGPEVADQ